MADQRPGNSTTEEEPQRYVKYVHVHSNDLPLSENLYSIFTDGGEEEERRFKGRPHQPTLKPEKLLISHLCFRKTLFLLPSCSSSSVEVFYDPKLISAS